MTHSIKQLFHIDAKIEDVFAAISSIDGLSNWWTTETTGSAEEGGVISFRFGSNGGPDMKVTTVKSPSTVTWECLESPHGWKGHTYAFHLDENDGKTRVRFSHDGWEENGDFYGICSFSWGRYMESLRILCQTGTGKAFGSANY